MTPLSGSTNDPKEVAMTDGSRTTLRDADHVIERGLRRKNVTYQLLKLIDGSCVIERVERTHFGGAFDSRDEARQHMIATENERKAHDGHDAYPWAIAVDASFGDERCQCYSCGQPAPWREAVLTPATESDPVDGVITRGVIFHRACWEAR